MAYAYPDAPTQIAIGYAAAVLVFVGTIAIRAAFN
jgi:hypothetical protein